MIPPILHFIWIKGRQFQYREYLCLKSALKNTPYHIFLHTDLEPGDAGIYCPYSLSHDRFTLIYCCFSLMYRGIKIRPATLSDIYRIQILQEHGGIYSDLDMLWLKEFPVSLEDFCLVAPWENQSYKIVTNCVIAAEKGYDFSLLLKEYDLIFDSLIKKNIQSIDGDTLKHHLTLFKTTSEFLKTNADVLLKRYHFGKNTWKTIWKFLTDKIPEEKIVLKGITGIHLCGCGLFGQYKINTHELLTKHSELKKIAREIDES